MLVSEQVWPKSMCGIRRQQIFLGGSSDENEKVLGKFLARKKRGSQIFRLRRAFFRCGGTENR